MTKKDVFLWIRAIVVIIGFVVLAYIGIFHHNVSNSSGRLQVNVFPTISEEKIEGVDVPSVGAKNYRLLADTYTHSEWNGLLGTKQVSTTISRIHWPNGGYTRFDSKECSIQDIPSIFCTSDDNKVYKIEIATSGNTL